MTIPLNENRRPRIAVIDYGVGNLASVRQACAAAGMEAVVTRRREEVERADGIILPGVGAFGSAVENLCAADLVGPLKKLAVEGRPILAICLGMQILMERGEEGGAHKGLGLVGGDVVRFDNTVGDASRFKVPHMGWNEVRCIDCQTSGRPAALIKDSDPNGKAVVNAIDGAMMYFAHSYYARLSDAADVVAVTDYGGVQFCSVLAKGSIIGCQFHPERSGPAGLAVFRAWAKGLRRQQKEQRAQTPPSVSLETGAAC